MAVATPTPDRGRSRFASYIARLYTPRQPLFRALEAACVAFRAQDLGAMAEALHELDRQWTRTVEEES